ncbi:uncharacterized protein LOC111218498 [Seriola dumerili]|uniref:uncharacterized protein LOC111218498 n=1 Tax=Seriola dumerili TaxID=41447 RepID=UPI000BBF0F73|nr:uncharacterized protein LOC111218498 [Seriola dumerili]
MRTLLGVLMVAIVSGDNEVTINGTLEGSVLLPCNCPERNLEKEFMWQIDEPNMNVVFIHNTNTSGFHGRYKDRAKIFVAENSSDCSLLLTKITADDQGKYKCSYDHRDQYNRFFINLNIFANYTVCQNSFKNGAINTYHCHVEGRYQEAEIQWYLEGNVLTNSSETDITRTDPVGDPNGVYSFESQLMTESNWTSQPTCDVKAKVISPIISNDCEQWTDPPSKIIAQPKYIMRYSFKIIPIVLVLGLSLFLWHRWKISRGLPRIRGMQSDDLQ